MTFSRMKKRPIKLIKDSDELYRKKLQKRQVTNVSIYSTAAFRLDDTEKDLNFSFEEEVWQDGYRLYKLSQKYYNSTEFWWVIGLFNQKPTDSHFESGDLVLIPYPLDEALEFIGVD